MPILVLIIEIVISRDFFSSNKKSFIFFLESWLWLNGREVDFSETPPSVTAPNNLIFPYQQQKPCGKIELLRPNETTILFGLMQQECTKTERALCKISMLIFQRNSPSLFFF